MNGEPWGGGDLPGDLEREGFGIPGAWGEPAGGRGASGPWAGPAGRGRGAGGVDTQREAPGARARPLDASRGGRL